MEEMMINNFSTEQLTKMIYEKLEVLGYEVTLSNPTTASKFPTIVMNTPLESTMKRYNTKILQKRFQVTIECWAKSKYEVMQMMEKVSEIMAEYNFIKTNTMRDMFDEITKAYRISSIFEVKYDGLTNSLM